MTPGTGAPVDSAALWTPYVDGPFVQTLRAYVRERIEPEADRIDREDVYPTTLRGSAPPSTSG